MGSAPTPPDPWDQASAQAAANREGAIASSLVNNPSHQRTPWGTQTHKVSGHTTMWAQNGEGQWQPIQVPRFSTDFRFRQYGQRRPGQEAVRAQAFAQADLAKTARERSAFLRNYLRKGIDTDGIPEMRTGEDLALSDVHQRLADAGPVQQRLADAGSIQQHLADAGPVQQRLADAGPVQHGYAPEDGFSDDRRRVEDAIMSRYDEAFARDQGAMRDRLAAEGLMPGSEAWNERMAQLDRARTDARMQAILAGGQEQSRLLGEARDAGQFANMAQAQQFGQGLQAGQFANMAQAQQFGQGLQAGQFANMAQAQQFGQGLQSGQFANAAQAQALGQGLQVDQMDYQNRAALDDRINAARQAMIQERYNERNQPLNEIAALLSSSQVTTPQFAPLYRQGIEPAPIGDYMQRQYEAELQAHQARQQGLFSLAGAAMQGGMGLLSDRRAKADIEPVGKLNNGLTVYAFRYRSGGPMQIGLMADEVEQVHPAAVGESAGLKTVDYGMAVQ